MSELAAYVFLWCCWRFGDARATAWVFLVPLVLMRFGLMVGNWGQHALVDEVEPDSDFRSSITLIDVAVSFPLPLSLPSPSTYPRRNHKRNQGKRGRKKQKKRKRRKERERQREKQSPY